MMQIDNVGMLVFQRRVAMGMTLRFGSFPAFVVMVMVLVMDVHMLMFLRSVVVLQFDRIVGRGEAFGKVDTATIIKDKYSGQSKGFGFVEMPSGDEARAAIEGLNGKDMKGRNINVNEARPRAEKRGGGGGGRGGGRRY